MSEFALRWLRTLFVVLFSFVSLLPATVEPATKKASVRALFCAYGGIGQVAIPPSPEFVSEFAVAVVEINSPTKTRNVAVTDFVLLDKDDNATKLKRVVKVEVFDETRIATDGECTYYLAPNNGGGTRPWNGTLPAGRIRLRVRVALVEAPISPVRFRLTIGRYVIEGPVDCSWPTG